MRIVLFGATARGFLFLQKLRKLKPESELIVFSFREESFEPPFLDNIRKLTLDYGGQFFESRQPGSEKWNDLWKQNPVDLMFAVSWRYMIPATLYTRARLGAFVFHDSLLPEYRGFSPTVWSIINGEDHTGVTLFHMADDVDSGDIVDQQSVPIASTETIAAVMERTTETYLKLLERNIEMLTKGQAPRRKQDHSRATFTCKRTPEDNRIHWNHSTNRIYNLIRAVSSPYSGAFTDFEGKTLRVWSAECIEVPKNYVGRVPGRIVEVRKGEGTVVLTGDGMLLLTNVQLEGSPVVCASEVLQTVGQTLG